MVRALHGPEHEELIQRIGEWEADGCLGGVTDGGWGPRSANADQLEGPVLDARDVAAILSRQPGGVRTERAVRVMASKSFALIEADLWADLTRMARATADAADAGKGWVEPAPEARDGPLSFLWDRVLLRGFPASPQGLKPSRDCPILTGSSGLAFAIVRAAAGPGQGHGWRFRRARVDVAFDEWRKPPRWVAPPKEIVMPLADEMGAPPKPGTLHAVF